jgi:hypothetical protein
MRFSFPRLSDVSADSRGAPADDPMTLRGFPLLLLLYFGTGGSTRSAICPAFWTRLRLALLANSAAVKGFEICHPGAAFRDANLCQLAWAAPSMRLRQLLPDATYDQLLTRSL